MPDATADLEASRREAAHLRHTLQALFTGLAEPVYIVAGDYHLVAVNPACTRLGQPASPSVSPPAAGAPPKVKALALRALPGRLCYQALFGRPQPCPDCRLLATLSTGQSAWWAERRLDDAGQPTEWEISTCAVPDESGQVRQVIVLNRDVTEKHNLEAWLARSEKLAAVGQLAAGVAHEINNPLAAIIANTQLLQRELPPQGEWQESLELIARAGDRALKVVRNLLDFAREGRAEFAATDVNLSVQSAIDLVAHQLFTHSITLECNFAPDLPPIQASPDHLQGVWLNLLLNARDALADRNGAIRLTTSHQNDAIHITIADTGVGIPPERLARIFDPFYTTKPAGQGTGLGLSLCQRIVKQHGGGIRVESQVGEGATFTVVLPVQRAPAT